MARRAKTFAADRPARPTAGRVDLSLVIDHERAMSKRQARLALEREMAHDTEYTLRRECHAAVDRVRILKAAGKDYKYAAEQARLARSRYIKKYQRDPNTLAPISNGRPVDVSTGAESWLEVK